MLLHYIFFFQAEDGIRDRNVTGVQTCALPIYDLDDGAVAGPIRLHRVSGLLDHGDVAAAYGPHLDSDVEIGRASCRERVEISVVGVPLEKKKEGEDGV